MRELSEEVAFSNGRFLVRCTGDKPFTDPDGSWGTRPASPGPDWAVWCWGHEKYTLFGVILIDEVAP